MRFSRSTVTVMSGPTGCPVASERMRSVALRSLKETSTEETPSAITKRSKWRGLPASLHNKLSGSSPVSARYRAGTRRRLLTPSRKRSTSQCIRAVRGEMPSVRPIS